MRRRVPLGIAAVALALTDGYLAGMFFRGETCRTCVDRTLFWVMALAAYGLLAATPPGRRALPERVSSLALVAYAGVLLVVEWTEGFSPLDLKRTNLLWLIAWLSIPVAGAALAPRRPFERARWPWWLMLSATMTVATYDATQ